MILSGKKAALWEINLEIGGLKKGSKQKNILQLYCIYFGEKC